MRVTLVAVCCHSGVLPSVTTADLFSSFPVTPNDWFYSSRGVSSLWSNHLLPASLLTRDSFPRWQVMYMAYFCEPSQTCEMWISDLLTVISKSSKYQIRNLSFLTPFWYPPVTRNGEKWVLFRARVQQDSVSMQLGNQRLSSRWQGEQSQGPCPALSNKTKLQMKKNIVNCFCCGGFLFLGGVALCDAAPL